MYRRDDGFYWARLPGERWVRVDGNFPVEHIREIMFRQVCYSLPGDPDVFYIGKLCGWFKGEKDPFMIYINGDVDYTDTVYWQFDQLRYDEGLYCRKSARHQA